MFKFVILSCLVAVAIAHPGYLRHGFNHGLRSTYLEPTLKSFSVHSEVPVVRTKLIHEPSTIAVQEHTIEKVGEHRESLPTAVSHQSQTIVHSAADKITPILAPGVRTRYEPTVRTYEKQYIEKVPVVEQHVVKTVHEHIPTVVKTYETPIIHEEPTLLKHYEHFDEGKQSVVVEAPSFEGHVLPTVVEGFPHGFAHGEFDHSKFALAHEIPLTKVIEGKQW